MKVIKTESDSIFVVKISSALLPPNVFSVLSFDISNTPFSIQLKISNKAFSSLRVQDFPFILKVRLVSFLNFKLSFSLSLNKNFLNDDEYLKGYLKQYKDKEIKAHSSIYW